MPEDPAPGRHREPGAGRHELAATIAHSGLLPVVLLALAVSSVLAAYDVPIGHVLLFGAYVVLGIALPGMLLLRMLRGGPAHIAEDLALGLALGYCLLTAAYLVARALGVPQLHVLWAVATVAAFVVVPRLRHHWRGGGKRAALAWTWAICAILAVLLLPSTGVFETHRLVGVDTPYLDMPYQLALIGELRHHFPPEVPYVAGEPLEYHWFYYVQAAATSWATGLEAVVLLYRLTLLPMVAGFVVLTAVAARRVTRRWWPGPVAASLALWGTVPAIYHWLASSPAAGRGVLDSQPLVAAWVSPTHSFGLLLFGATLLVVMDLLRRGGESSSTEWLLAAALVFGTAGSKASALPLLLAGLVTVLGVTGFRSRRLDRTAALATILVIAGLVFAIVFLFGGSTGGLAIGLDSLRRFPLASSVGALRVGGMSSVAVPAIVLGIAVILWGIQGSAAFALVTGRTHARGDPRVWLLLGAAAGGLGAVSLLSYPGLSQWYYLRGAAGVYGVLAAWGIARLAPSKPSPGLLAAVLIALAIGAASALAISSIGPASAPSLRRDGLAMVAVDLLAPVAALVVVLGMGFVLARAIAPRLRLPAGVLVIALAMGVALPAAVGLAGRPLYGAHPSDRILDLRPAGVEAARWLRDHSSPDELVATNLHCLRTLANGRCDARHFWVSAFSERRMLVEGWSYTTKALRTPRSAGITDRTAPFWDQERLAVNDAAFTSPASGVADLATRYGVRWLFADLATADEQELGKAATERFRAGQYVVYEVPEAP